MSSEDRDPYLLGIGRNGSGIWRVHWLPKDDRNSHYGISRHGHVFVRSRTEGNRQKRSNVVSHTDARQRRSAI